MMRGPWERTLGRGSREECCRICCRRHRIKPAEKRLLRRHTRTRRKREAEVVISEWSEDAGPIESYQCRSCDSWMHNAGYSHEGICEVCEREYPCSYCDPLGSLLASVGRILRKDEPWETKWNAITEAYCDSDITWRPAGDNFQREIEDFVRRLNQEMSKREN